MPSFSLFLYTLVFPLISGTARLFSPFFTKLRTFFEVRNGVFRELEKKIGALSSSAYRVWIHAASVGEFEQARPIIASLKAKRSDIIFFVSFFSDSGYNARLNFPAAAVFYLPIDTANNAKRLVSLLKPDVLLLMRYDFWPNHLVEAKKFGTKLILAAAVLQENSPYFNPILKRFYRSIFSLFDWIFTASPNDMIAFKEKFMCRQTETAGDPRFDQVLMRSKNFSDKVESLKPFFRNRTVLVAGSVWEKDVKLILSSWQELEEQPALILVPHQVLPEHTATLCGELQNRSIAFTMVSALNDSFDPDRQVLVIDQTGYLAELYAIASLAYVGGGFGVNVHNTLEPAVYGIPVVFGPNFHNSPEAEALVAVGGAEVIYNQATLSAALNVLVTVSVERRKRGLLAKKFVTDRSGATEKIADNIVSMLH